MGGLSRSFHIQSCFTAYFWRRKVRDKKASITKCSRCTDRRGNFR